MGTIKLKRGTGSPAGSLAQYEVAMDVAAQTLYVSSNGTDAVILANKYDDADAVSAVEAANLTLAGTVDTDSALTAKGGFTVDATGATPPDSYNDSLFVKRQVGGSSTGPSSGNRTVATLWRDLDSEVINSGFDNRGASLDYVLESDNQGTRQYLGGIAMQSGSDDDSQGNWIEASSLDSSYAKDLIFSANKDSAYIYGRILAQKSATLQNNNGDDEAPLVVKSDWDNNDAIAAEFWNLTTNQNDSITILSGTDDAGSKTYNNQLRSYRDGDKKYQYFDVLNDNGTFNQTLYEMNKDTNTGDIKHNMYGQVRIELSPGTGIPNTSLQIQTDMTNALSDLSTGVKTNLNWKAGTIPNGAESFQEFTVQDDTQGQLRVGYFGSKYASANNGELSTMKLAAQTHDGVGEEEISINQKEATATVPFKYQGYTTTARNALSGVNNGSVIYNTTDNKLQVYANGAWETISSS